MDQISITIEQEGKDNGPIFIQVHINEKDFPGILNIEEFFTIKQQNRLVALFTCGCGDFNCDGYYVKISCTNAAFIMHNSYHRFSRSLQSTFEYHLDWQQIREVAEEVFNYLQKIYEHNPRAYVTSGYTGENLIERIPAYQKSFLLSH